MHLLAVSLLSALVHKTAAQEFGGFEVTPIFDAPPLEDANIGINAFLAVATLIQLAVVISFVFRVRSQHIAPGIAAVVAMLILFVTYVLAVVFIVLSYLTDGFGDLTVSNQEYLNVNLAYVLFYDWSEPAMFLIIAFVIRDRCLAYDGQGPNSKNKRGLPLFPFMIVLYFLAFLIVVFSAATGGLALTIDVSDSLSIGVAAKLRIASDLLYALIAFYIVATILLIPMAVAARMKAPSDKIINVTLFAVVPLLLIRAISRMILVIIAAPSVSIINFNPYAYDFAASVTGILYFAVICILCYFFLSIRLWTGPGETEIQPYGGGYSGYQPHLQPVAQFPGQWGYPGMPPQQQQQGYVPSNVPYQTYPLPQHDAGEYYPNQQSGQQQDVQQQPSAMPGQGVGGGSPNADEKTHEPATQLPTDGVA